MPAPARDGPTTTHRPSPRVATQVAYDVAGFVERNRDALSHDVLSLMCCSSEGWLKATFQDKIQTAQKVARGACSASSHCI